DLIKFCIGSDGIRVWDCSTWVQNTTGNVDGRSRSLIIFVDAFMQYFRCDMRPYFYRDSIAGLIINIVCANQAVYQLESDGNNRLCAFRGFLLHAASGLLYQTVCVQTIHRLFVVVFSTRRYLQSKQMMIFITISQWLISITFAIPALIFGRIVSQPATVAGLRRKQREIRLIRRLIIIVGVIFFMSFSYLIFFLRAQFFPHAPTIPYAQRVSFIYISFGYSVWMLLNIIFTDKVRKYLNNNLQILNPYTRHTQIHPHTNNDRPLQTRHAVTTQNP
ncbi:unnamed protein product, partial [Adineta ricciae]